MRKENRFEELNKDEARFCKVNKTVKKFKVIVASLGRWDLC
jgi:hypothetical protein